MEEFGFALLVGVIASIIVLVVTTFSRLVIKEIVVPRWEELSYKEIEIKGNWTTTLTYIDSQKNDMSFAIKRKAHRVSGSVTCTSGAQKGRQWDFTGTFHNQIMTIYYQAADITSRDRGTFTLMVNGEGTKMKGSVAYLSYSSNQIETIAAELERTITRSSPAIRNI